MSAKALVRHFVLVVPFVVFYLFHAVSEPRQETPAMLPGVGRLPCPILYRGANSERDRSEVLAGDSWPVVACNCRPSAAEGDLAW